MRACLFTFHIQRYLHLPHALPPFDKHYQMSTSSSWAAISFNRYFAIWAAVRFGRNCIADGFNSFFFSSLLVGVIPSLAIQMDKVVELIYQLTSFQCVIEQLEWCCLCHYTDGSQCLSSNVLDFSLPFNQHYVTYVDFESFIFVFQVGFFYDGY